MTKMNTNVNEITIKPLELGEVVLTFGIQAMIESGELKAEGIYHLLTKHRTGDWGKWKQEDIAAKVTEDELRAGLPAEEDSDYDGKMNYIAIAGKYPQRVMSVYNLDMATIWIITESDRSVTTVLLPEEY